MAVVTIPTGLLFGPDCGWGQMRFDQVDESEADGSSDIRVRGRPRWTCTLVPPQKLRQGVEAQRWESMMLALKGKTNVLAAYDPVRPLPAGGAWSTLSVETRRFTKTAGGSAWNARGSSTNAYAQGCAVSFRVNNTADVVACGLTSDPLASDSFNTLDFAFAYFGGSLQVVENGRSFAIAGAYTSATDFTIFDDGTNITYYVDGVLKKTSASSGVPLFMSSSIFAVGSQVTNLNFGRTFASTSPFDVSLSASNIVTNFDISHVTLRAPGEAIGRAFSAGDKLQLGLGFGTSELVRVVSSDVVATVNGIKVLTIEFEPSARRYYDPAALVTSEKPVAYFGSTGDRVSWSYDSTGLLVKGFSFDGRERWR